MASKRAMSDATPQPTPVPQVSEHQPVYATFVGVIDQAALQRIFNGVSGAMQRGVPGVHMLFQSTGGTVSDGVALYNYLRVLPIEVSLYNVGTVSSIAALAYLGAKVRKTSARATFMLHRTQVTLQNVRAERLHGISTSIRMDDERTEKILRTHLKLSKKLWAVHEVADLWLSADEALECGLATEIGEFAPPPGTMIFSV